MTDGYIDYNEISEYGRPLVSALLQLVGLSEIVDAAKLAELITSKVDTAELELQKARNERSDLRDERTDTAENDEIVRDTVTRFYHHLRSLPKTTDFDFDAFFQGKVMGDLSAMKPADLERKAADTLRGFDADKNKAIAGFASWKVELETARQTLADALSGKGDATGKAFVATTGLIEARKDFLYAYNKVAKPIVRGLLHELGRGNELSLFFKDLAVNE